MGQSFNFCGIWGLLYSRLIMPSTVKLGKSSWLGRKQVQLGNLLLFCQINAVKLPSKYLYLYTKICVAFHLYQQWLITGQSVENKWLQFSSLNGTSVWSLLTHRHRHTNTHTPQETTWKGGQKERVEVLAITNHAAMNIDEQIFCSVIGHLLGIFIRVVLLGPGVGCSHFPEKSPHCFP